MGCKGPTTYNACSTVRWNDGVSFPIQSGHGCIGCSEDGFWDKGAFYDRLTDIKQFGVEANADRSAAWRRQASSARRSAVHAGVHAPSSAAQRNKAKRERLMSTHNTERLQPRHSAASASSSIRSPASKGHLRCEVNLDENNVIRNAVSTGTMWRGLEVILKGRDPRDAWAFTERICGVCTGTHALTSVRAVEDALGIKIPENANSIRNIMQLSLQVQDHLVHFYHLHALDWVDVVSALKADPKATSELAQSISQLAASPRPAISATCRTG